MNNNASRKIQDWQLVETIASRIPWFSAVATEQSEDHRSETQGPAPVSIELTIQGRGVERVQATTGDVDFAREHRVTINLPADYPNKPPEIQFESPLFHPNVSPGGLVHLNEMGLLWQPEITLDIVCERIWDVIRGAYIDLESSTNLAAQRWCQAQESISFPVDSRSLQDDKISLENIVSYSRKGRRRRSGTANEVMIIDDRLVLDENSVSANSTSENSASANSASENSTSENSASGTHAVSTKKNSPEIGANRQPLSTDQTPDENRPHKPGDSQEGIQFLS